MDRYHLRKIEEKDNECVKALVKNVLKEFGGDKEGLAYFDCELNDMYTNYQKEGWEFFVLTKNDQVMGCSGFAPLVGENETCELKKMYLYPEVRGLGFGQKLLVKTLNAAYDFGYKFCYLETLAHMDVASKLYQKVGFRPISNQMGNTGHCGCDRFYLMEFNSQQES